MKDIKKKELIWFVISGVLAVLTDMVSYFFLKEYWSPSIAKGISFCLGAVVAFFLNKYFTFEKKEKSSTEALKFTILYACSFAVNVYANKVSIDLLSNYMAAFIIATGCSTVMNFIGQKYWVFN